jgi:acetaldehyde dehydrogenase
MIERAPAEPPLIMRDTVSCLAADADPDAITDSIERMVREVAAYVPGYRLKQEIQVGRIGEDEPLHTLLVPGTPRPALKVSVFLEVEGAHYLPAYAGNLDIMTSAALRTAERLATAGRQAGQP